MVTVLREVQQIIMQVPTFMQIYDIGLWFGKTAQIYEKRPFCNAKWPFLLVRPPGLEPGTKRL